jgi:peptidoglycan/LPS O-acetylase OafA/YrhL
VRQNPALDGLRGMAVIFVIFFHINRPLFRDGKIGVDIFFVLSGYLITAILLNELRWSGGISLTKFYARRALRLLPALGVLAIFQLIRSMFSDNGGEIREATLIGVAYIENWNAIYQFGPVDLMGHTWSLAIEEQFYLIWPLILPLLIRNRPLGWLTAGFFAMMVARFVFWKEGYSVAALSCSLFLRPLGLLVGCALAFLPIQNWRLPNVALFVLLAPLLTIVFCADRGASTLITSLAAAGLIIYLQGARATESIFAASQLRYIGRISYGLYLYHVPIFMLTERWKSHLPTPLFEAGLIALIFAAAALSYEFIEKPVLSFKDKFQGRTTIEMTPGSSLAARL